MPDEDDKEPLAATVIGLAGKYVVLDVGADEGVQVNDVFEDGDVTTVIHPGRSMKTNRIDINAVTAEGLVERVFSDHCLVVLTYAARVPYFDDMNRLKAGEYEMYKGHPHRITSTGTSLGKPS